MRNEVYIFLNLVALVHSLPIKVKKKVQLPEEDALLFWKDPDAVPCEPFHVWYVDCNQCVCGADGIRSCTRVKCLQTEEIEVNSHMEQDHLESNDISKQYYKDIKRKRKKKKKPKTKRKFRQFVYEGVD